MGEVGWKYKFKEAKELCKLPTIREEFFHVLQMDDSICTVTMVFVIQRIYLKE